MPARSATPGQTSPTRPEVLGSAFDLRQPPALAKGLHHEVRRRAKAILAENPHLWVDTSQVEPVVRLARLRIQIEELDALIQEPGYQVENAKGELKPNPLMASRDGASRVAMQTERMLCIGFITRQVQVKRNERVIPAAPRPAQRNSSNGSRPLRLA